MLALTVCISALKRSVCRVLGSVENRLRLPPELYHRFSGAPPPARALSIVSTATQVFSNWCEASAHSCSFVLAGQELFIHPSHPKYIVETPRSAAPIELRERWHCEGGFILVLPPTSWIDVLMPFVIDWQSVAICGRPTTSSGNVFNPWTPGSRSTFAASVCSRSGRRGERKSRAFLLAVSVPS